MAGLHHHHHHPSHDKAHGHHHGHATKQAEPALRRALLVTLAFMGVELVGGLWSNSLALVSDAAHMLGDSGALLLSLFVVWLSKRPPSPRMTFGYHRVEILGALISGVGIWGIAAGLVYESIQRLSAPPEVHGQIVSIVAAIGLLANLVSIRLLHSAQGENLNVRAAYLHVAADALGSIGALIAGLVLWFSGWRPIDPIVTLIMAALMVLSSWSLVRESLAILLESTPGHVDPEKVTLALKGLPGIVDVHDLHVWSLSSGRAAMSAHVVVPTGAQTGRLLEQATQILDEQFGLHHTTLQFEESGSRPSEHCDDCGPVNGESNPVPERH
jgi:cobalt-zinc-cadmium efflux system protein